MEVSVLEKDINSRIIYSDVLSVVIDNGFISIKTEDGFYLRQLIDPDKQIVIAPEVDLLKSYKL